MKDITDADYISTKIVCKDFEIKILGEYRDFYLQSDTLLLADVFGNFRNIFLEMHELDSFSYFNWISMTSSLKKD